MVDDFSLFGDPVAGAVQQQGFAIIDEIRRRDTRFARQEAEWSQVSNQLAYERDLARHQLRERIAAYNTLINDYNTLVNKHNDLVERLKRRDANGTELAQNRDEWADLAIKLEQRVFALEDELALLRAQQPNR